MLHQCHFETGGCYDLSEQEVPHMICYVCREIKGGEILIVTLTCVSAARVLGSLIRAILTVKLSVTLPFLLVEAAAVGTAELIWTTCWVFYTGTRVCLSLTSASLAGTTTMTVSHNLFCGLPAFLFPDPQSHKHSPHSGDSSEPSEQSMSWSHTKCLGIHCLFWHMNSFSTSQVLLVYTGSGKEQTVVNGHGTVLGVFLGFFLFLQ